jgi:hypothetical protein
MGRQLERRGKYNSLRDIQKGRLMILLSMALI